MANLLKFCFIIGILFSSNILSAQYLTMLDTTNRWQYRYYSRNEIDNEFIYVFKIIGDTTLNGKAYKKLFMSQNSVIQNTNHPLKYKGAIREDTAAKKVYYLGNADVRFPACGGSPDSLEAILYDFSLKAGDTFRQTIYAKGRTPATRTFIVTQDTTTDKFSTGGENGKKRKVLILRPPLNNRTICDSRFGGEWIEGAGASSIFFLAVSDEPGEGSYYFECFNSRTPTGNLCTSPTEEVITFEKQVQVVPNPTSQELRLLMPDFSPQTVGIWDLQGRLLKQVTVSNSQTIDVHFLPNGIYLLQVQYKNYPIYKRFMVQH